MAPTAPPLRAPGFHVPVRTITTLVILACALASGARAADDPMPVPDAKRSGNVLSLRKTPP